ncbi:recombinase family protein [Parathermosynechococcus lividus]
MLRWISGGSRSGKTHTLVGYIAEWLQAQQIPEQPKCPPYISCERSLLLLTDTGEGRDHLSTQIERKLGAGYFPYITTPLGFMQDEVMLFWPLLVKLNAVAARPPLRLATELELLWAKALWHSDLEQNTFAALSDNRDRAVRHLLDIFQLAAFAGMDLPEILTVMADHGVAVAPETMAAIVAVLSRWRHWCTQHSLLTYGIIADLFGRVLLRQQDYQLSLRRRFRGIVADNIHNYPALVADLLGLLASGIPPEIPVPPDIPRQAVTMVLSYQPTGVVRLGLGADPDAFLALKARATVEELSPPQQTILGLGDPSIRVAELLTTPQPQLPPQIVTLQTTSRMQLLSQICATVTQAVRSQQVMPQEIAILGPGIDTIARYVLTTELGQQGIPVVVLNDQRPLIQSPYVRALLTVLMLVYPGISLECSAGAIAELLEVFHAKNHEIDAVRAGLLAAHCLQPRPLKLLAASHYSRWDRLGHRASTAYETFRTWLSSLPTTQPPTAVMDAAIQRYLWPQNLPATELAALRSLLESAADYWQVCEHLHTLTPPEQRLEEWIRLLRRGTVTADPPPLYPPPHGVLLATTFQYRSTQQAHRWHFWLDASSPRWQDGGLQTLWQAPMFLRQGTASPSALVWQSESERLQQLLVDLCSRVSDRLYLCHSDLAANGREQNGSLLAFVDLAAGSMDGSMIDTANSQLGKPEQQ